MVTWSDGKPAIPITCDHAGQLPDPGPGDVQGPNYTVLNMDNMPTRGDMTMSCAAPLRSSSAAPEPAACAAP